MHRHLSPRGYSDPHQSIHTRIHRSHLFLRIADVTSDEELRHRCLANAVATYGAAVDHLEASAALTNVERSDIEKQLDELHIDLKQHAEMTARIA